MKILEYCDLLQACEYLAFGWKPLSDEDEMFCAEERWRPYLRYGCGTYEKVNPMRKKFLRAREQLGLLFTRGLTCYSNRIPKKLPKSKRDVITHELNIQVRLGTVWEYTPSDVKFRPPYIEIQNFKCRYKNRYIRNVLINFAELQKLHEEESAEIIDVYNLFIDKDLYLCCQKNSDEPVRLKNKPFNQNADNYFIMKHVMSKPGVLLTQKDIENNTPVKFSYEKGINNKLQSVFTKIPNIKPAFFDILDAQEIRFRKTVTNRDLELENIKTPI